MLTVCVLETVWTNAVELHQHKGFTSLGIILWMSLLRCTWTKVTLQIRAAV